MGLSKLSNSLIQKIDEIDDDINLELTKNAVFQGFFNHITNIYKSIKTAKYKENMEYTREALYPNKGCTIMELFRFLNDKNILDGYMGGCSAKDQLVFKHAIKNNNMDLCTRWVNLKGKDLMRKIYTLIQNESIHNRKIPRELLDRLNVIDRDIYSEFTSLEILHEMENLLEYRHNYRIKFNNNNNTIIVNLKIYSKNKTINKKFFDNIVKRILLMGLVKQYRGSMNNSDNKSNNNSANSITINIILVLTNKKKVLNTDYTHMGPKEINSGLASYGDNTTSKIVIYRMEELSKLLIHELVHYLKLDFTHIEFADFFNYVNISPSTPITPNESFTEIVACFINCIACSYEHGCRKNIKLANKYINYELKYNIYQVAKILCYFGFKDASDFFRPYTSNNSVSQKKDSAVFKQTTNVFSYFIIKTSLLFVPERFLIFFKRTDNLSLHITNNHSKDSYIKMVKSTLLNPGFINKINEYMEFMRSYKQKTLLYNTLRMTIIEM